MRDLPHDQHDRSCPAGTVALQGRRPPCRPGRRLQIFRGFAKADFVWDDARLDAWLTNPQAVIPGAVMAYRQAKPETRAMIIAYLKELN